MFEVSSPFRQDIIDVFRSTPRSASVYEPARKTWKFSTSLYDDLVTKLEALNPPLKVQRFPSFIMQIIQNVSKYQNATDEQAVVERELSHKNGRVLIADDMGLGKTFEALGAVSYYKQEWPLLIICPSSLKYTWEISNNLVFVKPEDIVVVNSARKRLPSPSQHLVVIVSYDIMSMITSALLGLKFNVVIVDECHFLKNFKTGRFKAASKLLKASRRVILLSGTPALSKPSELFTQISCVAPRLFRSFPEFGDRYCNPREINIGGKIIKDYSGASNLPELHLLLNETIMIRRSKEEVMSQLPSKVRKVVILDLNLVKDKADSLVEAKTNYQGDMEQRGLLLTFFAETAVAKLPAVNQYITEMTERNGKFLVFAHHRVIMDSLSSLLAVKSVGFIRIDGSTTSENRKKLCDQFQTNPEVKLALLSITAASTGITLTAANMVIFAELFWNPGTLLQAEDRAHRVGQQSSVSVVYLVAKGTADDFLWTMVKKKLTVLNTGGLSGGNLEVDEQSELSGRAEEKLEV
ncbi:unnamed protein product [Soboliphyme baturini]|uniref:SWI/SNF-related matrix-associated actin-dependent regulator of chromatin subfamily A-like protein 1 n=2 Tax=Soboliphyme baturini TaxID=241478 RepID=A0A183IJW5_9BILA|nr:unnamed protein product [Soboliphyme baturini]